MNRKLISEKAGEISCNEVLPRPLKGYQLDDEPVYGASWESGHYIFQEVDWGVRIRYANYNMHQDDQLRIVDDRPLLALQFILENSFYGNWGGIGRRIDHEGSFNLFYAPSLEQTLESRKAYHIYSKVEFQFPREKLEELAPYFPMLEHLLLEAEKGNPALLHPANQIASSKMLTGVQEMLHNFFRPEVKKLYAEAKSMTTLITALDAFDKNKLSARPPKLTPYEVEQVYAAKDIAIGNLEIPISVNKLAAKVGTNTYKLNRAFKEIYGVTVFDYVVNARMDEAQYLLLDTNESIEMIAYTTGYNDVHSFSKAFKKRFKSGPAFYRASPFFFLGGHHYSES